MYLVSNFSFPLDNVTGYLPPDRFVHSFIHSFQKYVSGPVLCVRNIEGNINYMAPGLLLSEMREETKEHQRSAVLLAGGANIKVGPT